MTTLPIFYSDSCGRAINTWAEEKDYKPGSPKSILTLCKEANLKQCFFVSNSFYDFTLALKLTEKADIQLIFGLELLMCPDRKDHSELSAKQNHRVIVFGKNGQSYYDLIKLYSAFKTDKEAKYYKYRCDDEILNKYWTDNLILTLPFFDNFIAQNLLKHNCNIVPKFPTDDIVIFREVNTEHPHEFLINQGLNEFNKDKKYQEVQVKSIYYENREDIDAYVVYRGIQNRANFHEPEVPYLCSNAFCFEDWKDLAQK